MNGMKRNFYRYDNSCVLNLQNVSYMYDEKSIQSWKKIIDDFNFEVHQGEFVVLVGPSGCGKTTLLSLMAGIIQPTAGKITMMGEEIRGMDWKREIIFQSPTLFPWYDVFDNVAYGPKMRGEDKTRISDRVNQYLELVGLADCAHAKTYELSGGMKQRVALARVLINEPSVILMDEPFGALDAITRCKMQILVRKIWRDTNNTVVLITHDVDEALELASRIVVLGDSPCRIKGMFNAMFSTPLDGNVGDDKLRRTGEYIELRRHILDLL
jgi:taurine transport system ATP-binding protein